MRAIERDEIQDVIESVNKVMEKQLSPAFYEIVDRGVPHQPEKLLDNKMGVCIFVYQKTILMIGKTGPNSSPRFVYQHYNPSSANSTLAGLILKDDEMKLLGLTSNNIGEWIKNNCQRIDIIIDVNVGITTLQSIKLALHQQFEPKYGRLK